MENSGIRLLAFATAIIPAFIVFYYFIIAARERVDGDLIWAAFGFGAASALPTIMVAQLIEYSFDFGTGIYETSAGIAFLQAAIPEEIFKFVAVLSVCWKQLEKLSPRHLFTLAVGSACGFACFENIFYVLESDGWYITAIHRSITAVPGHAFVGAVMGYFIVKAVRYKSAFTWCWWMLALVLPVALHGGYDFFLFASDYMKARHVGALVDTTQWLLTGFVIFVFIEGFLAHWALISVMRFDKNPTNDSAHQMLLDKPFFQKIGEGCLLWLFLGLLCFVSTAMLVIAASSDDRSAMAHFTALGLAAIFSFHGVAFIGLSYVLRRRKLTLVH